jgi:hypothetical protein
MGPVHAGLVMLLRSAPRLILEMLIERGKLPPGEYTVEVRATEVWILDGDRVSERRVDVALEVVRVSDGWRGGFLIEAQLNRDEKKLGRWLEVQPAFEQEFGEDLCLVPITLTDAVEAWLRESVLPFVGDLQTCLIGPSTFPQWKGFDPRVEPERTLFMAMVARRGTREQTARLRAALRILDRFQGNTRMLYGRMLLSHFKDHMLMKARKYYRMSDAEINAVLDRYPGYEPSETEKESVLYTNGLRDGKLVGQEDAWEQGVEVGREETQTQACETVAEALLRVFETRGLEVPELARARIAACRDLPTLVRWLAEAPLVAHVHALFAGES